MHKRDYSDYLSVGVPFDEPDWHPDWLIRDLLPANTVTILCGVQKVGKSLLRSHLLVASVTGRPALSSLPVTSVKRALLLAGEERAEVEHTRLRKAARGLGVNTDLPIDVLPPCGFRLDDENDFNWLEESVRQEGYGLVVIDPLIRFHRRDENVAGQMSEPLTNIRHLATLTTVLLVHHRGKPREGGDNMDAIGHALRGSSDIAAIYDYFVLMKGVGGKNRNLRSLEFDSRHSESLERMRFEFEFCDDPYYFRLTRQNEPIK